ncbi:hypothetical protein XI08_15350 [Bradyrhizobium sp. CCBAU 11361]|nr:hypothetical protein [Bradyrhizobium sp. CCBAU 11361]
MRKRLGGIDSVHKIMRALPKVREPFWKGPRGEGCGRRFIAKDIDRSSMAARRDSRPAYAAGL